MLGLEHVDRREPRLPGDAIPKINSKTDVAGPKRCNFCRSTARTANSLQALLRQRTMIDRRQSCRRASLSAIAILFFTTRAASQDRTIKRDVSNRQPSARQTNSTVRRYGGNSAHDARCGPSTRSAGSKSAEASSSSDRRCRTRHPRSSSPSFRRTAPSRPSTGCNGKTGLAGSSVRLLPPIRRPDGRRPLTIPSDLHAFAIRGSFYRLDIFDYLGRRQSEAPRRGTFRGGNSREYHHGDAVRFARSASE